MDDLTKEITRVFKILNESRNFIPLSAYDEYFGALQDLKTIKSNVVELEQQLSNSISKDELRGLVDDLSRMTEMEYPRKEIVAKLNKLIEGDKNG